MSSDPQHSSALPACQPLPPLLAHQDGQLIQPLLHQLPCGLVHHHNVNLPETRGGGEEGVNKVAASGVGGLLPSQAAHWAPQADAESPLLPRLCCCAAPQRQQHRKPWHWQRVAHLCAALGLHHVAGRQVL